MREVSYEQMLPYEIVERRTKHPVAYLPLGGIEWHGEHLATGNDALKAHRLCQLAAAKGGGIAFPPLWYGEPRDLRLMETSHDRDGRIRGKMKLPAANFKLGVFGTTGDEQLASYQRLLMHVLIQIRTLGFKAIVIVTGHYPIREWAQPVACEFNKRFKDCQAWAGIEYHYGPGGKPSARVSGDHAAKWETSYLMHLRPECVDMSVFLGRSPKEKLIGVMGDDPRTTASRELGRQACRLIVDGMIRRGHALLRKARRLPR